MGASHGGPAVVHLEATTDIGSGVTSITPVQC